MQKINVNGDINNEGEKDFFLVFLNNELKYLLPMFILKWQAFRNLNLECEVFSTFFPSLHVHHAAFLQIFSSPNSPPKYVYSATYFPFLFFSTWEHKTVSTQNIILRLSSAEPTKHHYIYQPVIMSPFSYLLLPCPLGAYRKKVWDQLLYFFFINLLIY